MSTNHTPNYNLCQWEPGDQVKRTDFNEDNTKIDAALKLLSASVSGKAEDSALSALAGTVASMQNTVGSKQDASGAVLLAVGSYTGTTNTSSEAVSGSQKVSLPFTPQAVLVIPESGGLYNSNAAGYVYGGLAVTGCPGMFHDHTTLEIISGGFRVYTYWSGSDYYYIRLNDKGDKYHYIALG